MERRSFLSLSALLGLGGLASRVSPRLDYPIQTDRKFTPPKAGALPEIDNRAPPAEVVNFRGRAIPILGTNEFVDSARIGARAYCFSTAVNPALDNTSIQTLQSGSKPAGIPFPWFLKSYGVTCSIFDTTDASTFYLFATARNTNTDTHLWDYLSNTPALNYNTIYDFAPTVADIPFMLNKQTFAWVEQAGIGSGFLLFDACEIWTAF